MSAIILCGHCLDVLSELPDESVRCVVTSPPYWGLRDYVLPPTVWGGEDGCAHVWGDELVLHQRGKRGERSTLDGGAPHRQQKVGQGQWCQRCGAWRGQLGLEPTPELYVEHLVAVFREVRRVLRKDGTMWLNLGDSYAGSGKGQFSDGEHDPKKNKTDGMKLASGITPDGLKSKDLVGIPWRVAFALQADGWWLRSDIIWAKPNPMPESVTDRPTKSHEYVFLLSKSAKYFYDAEAVREPAIGESSGNASRKQHPSADVLQRESVAGSIPWEGQATRNARSVWTITPTPYRGAHFATMPVALAERCIMAGSKIGDVVLDPFGGAGTTALAATKLGRDSVSIEMSPDYCAMTKQRLDGVQVSIQMENG